MGRYLSLVDQVLLLSSPILRTETLTILSQRIGYLQELFSFSVSSHEAMTVRLTPLIDGSSVDV